MYKKVVLLICLAVGFMGFSQTGSTVYVREATNGEVGGQFKVKEYKKGYMLYSQDIKYDYVYEPIPYQFKKKDHFFTFVKNIKSVYGWKDQLNLEDYPDGYNFTAANYAIEWSPEYPNHITVKLNNDLDKFWDGYIILSEIEINKFYNTFFN